MEEREKAKLDKILALAQENNRFLKSIRRAQWMGRVMSLVYLVLIVGASLGAYYFIQPYVGMATSLYGNFVDGVGTVGGFFKQ